MIGKIIPIILIVLYVFFVLVMVAQGYDLLLFIIGGGIILAILCIISFRRFGSSKILTRRQPAPHIQPPTPPSSYQPSTPTPQISTPPQTQNIPTEVHTAENQIIEQMKKIISEYEKRKQTAQAVIPQQPQSQTTVEKEVVKIKPPVLEIAPTGKFYCPYCKREIPESEAIFVPSGDGWSDEDIIAGLESLASIYGLKRGKMEIPIQRENGTYTARKVLAYARKIEKPKKEISEEKVRIIIEGDRIMVEGASEKISEILPRIQSLLRTQKQETKITREQVRPQVQETIEVKDEVAKEFEGELGEGEIEEELEKEIFEESEEEEET